jgi:predicted HicB family RNase H-like nuclease
MISSNHRHGGGGIRTTFAGLKEIGMIAPDRLMEVKRTIENLYAQTPDWVTFYREVLGLRGIVRQVFPTRESLAAFEQTVAYQEILQLLTKLREQGPPAADEAESTRVITVRLPKSLHESLQEEAFEHRTSMNKLCISKLLQFIDSDKVPSGSRSM